MAMDTKQVHELLVREYDAEHGVVKLQNVEHALKYGGCYVVGTLLDASDDDPRIASTVFPLLCSLIARGELSEKEVLRFVAITKSLRVNDREHTYRLENALAHSSHRNALVFLKEVMETTAGNSANSMGYLEDLTEKTPQEWDAIIESELSEAGIEVYKFREYDSPNSGVKHTLGGRLGKWSFSRDEYLYMFWGDIPLVTAEIIALDKECAVGCMPGQWLPSWCARPDITERHMRFAEYVSWIENGMFRVKDEGHSERWKEAMQHDADGKLKFVVDPSAAGRPFIQTYTFFTLAALKNFVTIAKRHRLEFAYTR